MNFLPTLLRRILIAIAGVALGIFAMLIQSSCTHQLTVEEADEALSISCLVLAQAMTIDHPERLHAVLAQVCQPGRTREFISRVIARGPDISPREFLDLDFDAPSPAPPADTLPGDAGVVSSRRGR